jgi:hypothetical protein
MLGEPVPIRIPEPRNKAVSFSKERLRNAKHLMVGMKMALAAFKNYSRIWTLILAVDFPR